MALSQVSNLNIERYSNINFQKHLIQNKHEDNNISRKENSDEFIKPSLKSGALLSSMLGVGITSALIAKKQGFSLNPKVIF